MILASAIDTTRDQALSRPTPRVSPCMNHHSCPDNAFPVWHQVSGQKKCIYGIRLYTKLYRRYHMAKSRAMDTLRGYLGSVSTAHSCHDGRRQIADTIATLQRSDQGTTCCHQVAKSLTHDVKTSWHLSQTPASSIHRSEQAECYLSWR